MHEFFAWQSILLFPVLLAWMLIVVGTACWVAVYLDNFWQRILNRWH